MEFLTSQFHLQTNNTHVHAHGFSATGAGDQDVHNNYYEINLFHREHMEGKTACELVHM